MVCAFAGAFTIGDTPGRGVPFATAPFAAGAGAPPDGASSMVAAVFAAGGLNEISIPPPGITVFSSCSLTTGAGLDSRIVASCGGRIDPEPSTGGTPATGVTPVPGLVVL